MQAVEKRKRSDGGGNEGESRITRPRRKEELTTEEVEVEEFFTILRRMHMAASYLGCGKGKVEGSAAGARWKPASVMEDEFVAAHDAIAPIGDGSGDSSVRQGQGDCRTKEGRKEGEEEGNRTVNVKAGSVRRGLDLNMDPEAEPSSPHNFHGGLSI